MDNGAAAILSIEDLRQDDNEPAEVPICVVPNLEEAASKLAVAFHDYPSSQMTVVGVTGKGFLWKLIDQRNFFICIVPCLAAD